MVILRGGFQQGLFSFYIRGVYMALYEKEECFMTNFIKELAKDLAISMVSTIGLLTAIVLWTEGLEAIAEKGAKKVFSKKEES